MTAELPQALIREFVIAAHSDLAKVKAMLAEQPGLLTVAFEWGPGDFEDGLGAASHVGTRDVAEFFLAQGIPLNICAAAMLGRLDDVRAFLDADPAQANARGAHQIPVMFHAALGGNTAVADLLKAHGCTEGYSSALHGAISRGHTSMVAWLLDNGASDLTVKDYRGKSLVESATEAGHTPIADLLRARGAQ